jgi:FdhE protein
VVSQFIRKLFGRKPVLPPEVIEAQADLARLGEEKPTLAELAGQLSEYLSVIYAEPAQAVAPAINAEVAAEKLTAGVPLLRGESVDLGAGAETRLKNLVSALARFQPDAAALLAQALRAGKLATAELTAAVLDGQPQRIHEHVESLGLDVPLTASLLVLALYPDLVALRAGLQALLPSSAWEKGYCPVCGGFAKLGEFRGLEQIRFLRCSLCAAEWQFPRLRCPGCDNRDHRQLGYLHVDGEENKCRAATCEECRLYIKMVSTLGPLTPLQLLVTDVATIHLDLIAADKGYLPPM